MRHTRWQVQLVVSLITLTLLIVASGCSGVRLISDYDDTTDKALTQLQQTTDDFITKLVGAAGTDANAFAKHKEFYDNADQQLRRIEFRVNSIPHNTATIKLVSDIRKVLLGSDACSPDGTSLRDLHCLSANQATGPSKTALQIAQRNINQTIGAALSLELAKKQGLAQNSK